MSKDSNDNENHAGKIAVSVPDKNFGRIPIVEEKGERDSNKG
jgi:hypothetical protein